MNKHIKKKALTLLERERIGIYKAQGKSARWIGRLLGRSHTTISRELKRNNRPHKLMNGYVGHLAQEQSKARKVAAGKRPRLKHPSTRFYVQQHLKMGWSPEQISGRLALELPGMYVSHEAIYQYIYAEYTQGKNYLARRHPKRYPKHYARKAHRSPIPNRVSISHRSESINNRKMFGHWESDSIESRQSCTIINVALERKSRFTKLNKLPSKHADETHQALSNALAIFPQKARKSITYDNGPENYAHIETNEILGSKSYFCEPYHSWEKGAVENINSLIRRFIPKKTNLADISENQLQQIEDLLNNRPRKCLGFRTPNEVFQRFCYKLK